MAQEDNLHKLYINLTDDGYNLGTEDEFRKQLQNKATAEKFHQNMVDDGYQLGSFDEFVSMNGLSYQMPQSQLPADQVERRVQTARVPQPGERIEATHVDKDGNVLQTDTTQLVRGKVATVEIGTPQFTPPSSHEGEELARRNGYYNTKESLDDSFSYRPNEYGEMRYGWQRGQRIKQLNRTGLEFMNRTGAYDENYDQAASQAEKMSDAQLVAEFNKLSGQIADAEALAGTADGYAMATVLRAYSHELRARDIGFAHGSENKKGIGQYQAAKQDPAVAAEILKQEAMSPEQRKAYLANAYKHIMAGEEGAPDIAMLAGTMIHAKESGIFPEEAYSQVVGIINNEHAEDVLAGALQSADAEIERLSQLIEQRTQQLYAEDEAEGMSLAKVMQHAESGSGAPIFNQRLLNDPELSMLWTAKRAAERRKKVIERKQDNHGFMRQFIGTFWDTATDINTWDFGIQDMRDAVNLASFSGNERLSAPMERAREAMLQNTVDAQEAEQRWKLSAAQRWGVIGGQALPFVAEFIGTGGGFSGVRQGVTKGVTSFLERSLGKAASNKAAQWLVRSTGMLTGDIASALLMANTTGSLKTYSDILDRKTGDLMQLYDGTFVYRNSTTMGDAILKGEVANTLEYYTEMLGNHLDGLISGAGKRLGLSRLSEGMKWLTGRQIQQLTTNVLRQGGINELPSEILEEEANLILNAMLVGDNNFDTGPLKELANKFGCNFEVDPNSEDYQRSIFNPETQADIWGGMLFSIGAMRAPSVAIGTIGQGWNAANYYYYKHKTDLAGTKLNGLVGGDELLDRINNTTNEQIPSLVAGILADDDFTPDMKSLAMDYIGNLVKERGYNVRMFDNAKDLDPEQDQEEGETVDLSYQDGYNAADEEQAGVKERVDVARAWLYNLGFDDSNIESLNGELPEDWLAALSDEQREAVEEYTNAMAAYEGMLQHVQDDMEGAIAESDAAVDQQTHPETGAVHHAVLKTGGEVWVVGGNVALTPEGNIDIENSDGDLIVLDPATGGKRMIHVSDLASADEPVMAEQLKEETAATIQESSISDASNRIDGVLPFQPGDVYTLPFDDGQEHTITVIGDAGDGVNIVASVDGGEQQLMPMQMIQGAADQQREARIAEQAAMDAAASQQQPVEQEPEATEEVTEEPVEEEQPDEDAMPMNGDEVDWFATSPERGHRFLYDEAGLSPEEADAVVANSVKDAEKELEKVSKKAPKPGNAAQLNKYRAEKAAHEQQVAAAQAAVDYWKGVQATQEAIRQQAEAEMLAQRAEEGKQRSEAAAQTEAEKEAQRLVDREAARQEREALNGVPDVVNDKPEDARARGFRNVNGERVDRQLLTNSVGGRTGSVKFSTDVTVPSRIAVIEADELQPSHIEGQRNPLFFLDEAQPKNRTDQASDVAAEKIAKNINPEEITGDGGAYQFSAPTVNERGEVVQGNNRSSALKRMWSSGAYADSQQRYKQYLIDHAEEFGLNPQLVASMNRPVMVNEISVDDAEAIRLGQMSAKDLESGGIERIDPVTTARKLGPKMRNFASVLLSGEDENMSLAELIAANGEAAVKWLADRGVISPTQVQSAWNPAKTGLTAEAKLDLQNILRQQLFQGGVSDLPHMFEAMPAKAQKAILSTFMRDMDSADADRILPELQHAIEAWYGAATGTSDFSKATNYEAASRAMLGWANVRNAFSGVLPSEKFSKFAIELANRLQGSSMRNMVTYFNEFYDLVQGTGVGDLFGSGVSGEKLTLAEAIAKIFNVDINETNNGQERSEDVGSDRGDGQERRQGEPGDAAGTEPAAPGAGAPERGGRAESNDQSVAQAEAEVDTEPTDGQKEAGNYKKGHVKIDGFDVTIEQPKGSVRSGVDASGKAWSQEMHNTYGYIRGTEGVDGDHIDVFLSDHLDNWNGMVYVVDQVNKDGSFDEHKVMYGFDSEQEARDAYLSNYEEGWTGLGNITGVTRDEFKKWVDSSHRKTKPFAEYKSVKVSRPIQGLEGYTEDEILADVRAFIEQQLEDAGIEGVTIKGMALHGSRMRGDARPDSDLDVVVEYEGDISEDSFFNLVNYDLNFRGPNGIIIDINPITRGKSGTLEQYMERSRRYDEEKQNADKAGAHETAPQAENEMKPVEEPSSQPYTITPTKYTTKKGKELDVWLVKFSGEIDKKQATEIAKETRGWWDREQGGFLMRSEEAARDLAERVASNKPEQAGNGLDNYTEEELTQKLSGATSQSDAIPEQLAESKKTAETGNKQAETEPKREKVTGKRSAYVNSQIDVIARELASRDVVQGTVEAMPREGDLYAPFFDWVQEYIVKNYADLQSSDHVAVLHEFFGHKDWSPKENTDRTFKALSDLIKRTKEIIKQNKQAQAAASENASKPASEGPKRIVSDDRMAELKARLRNKLGGQLNVGIDPELLAIGAELAVGHIERGLTKFADYAKAMLEDVGDVIRPYLKSFYNAVRDMPEAEAYAGELTPYDEVRQFDIANFDKEGPKDVVATAKSIVDEQKAEQDVGTIRKDEVAAGDLKLRAATEEDIEAGKQLYHNGEPVFAVMVTHQGHQTDSFQFTKPHITSVLLTNGKYVDPRELQVAEETEAKKAKKTSKNKKKDVSSQGVGSLFDLEPAEEETNQPSKQEENGLPRTDELRPEGLPADSDNEGEPTSRLGQAPGQEGRGSDRGGDSSRGRELRENLHDGLRHADQLEGPSPKLNQSNNHAQRGKDYAPKDVDARIEANIAAIELMKQLIESGKKATPKEMSVLRKFSGWGGLGKAFNESAYGWREDGVPNRLRKLLGEEGYQQAIDSRRSAYYTPAKVIDALWDIARALGFKGGNVLEGSAGIGNIIGLMPADMSERSQIHAVEIDGTTGNILSLLYPDAKVEIQGFQDTRVQNGSIDLAITNVPFITGAHVIDSTGDKDLSKRFRDIHDFCIAKNVRKLREGGIGIFITSSGTLDNSQKLRDWLVSEGNADVVGAFRMNNTTFGGTGATSDIIVVRKRVNGQKSANAIDVSTVTGARTVDYETGEFKTVKGKQVPETKPMSLDYNRYFVEHPEMMGGEMAFAFEKGETYRETSKALYPKRGINQDERLAGFIGSLAEKDWSGEAPAQQAPTEQAAVYEELGEGVKEGSMLIDSNGKLCVASYGRAVPLEVNDNKIKGRTKQQCFKDYCAIKDAVNAVLDYQTEHDDDAGLQPLLDKLNKVFDDFVGHYGHFQAISGKPLAISFLRNDMDFSSIAALESKKEYNDEKNVRQATYTKSDIFTRRVVKKEAEPKPTTVKDGVITSIYKFGRVDVPYISEQLGKGADEVKDEIIASGLGFENPLSREVEVSYEYLSGNVREKLRQAHENNEDGRYDTNIKALEAVIPMNIPAHLIEFTLGSSWLDPKLYSDFISERTGVKARVALIGGTWIVDVPGYYFTEQNRAMGVESKMCDKVIYGHELMAAALQNKTVRVSKTTKYRDGHSETIVDKEATQACSTKIDEIRQDFKDWAREKMQSDPDMSAQVEEVYNESFNNYVPREIPDSFVPEYFGGAARHIKLNPHQAKAAIRATTQNVMLAHEVGTGKTFTLITTAMEMRRLGTARKPMIVVQNATVGQFVASAKELYPKAKVLTLEDADRTAEGRKAFYAKIKYNDWDMIVIPQSAFEMIPDSEERQMNFVRDKIEEKMLVLEQMAQAGMDTKNLAYKQAEREVEKLEEELNLIAGAASEKRKKRDEKRASTTRENAEVAAREMLDRKVDDVEDFDQMGIDAILVDEAHEYKHLGFATAMQRGVKGVDPSYSKKSQGVFLKCQSVMERTGGKNVVFATGTPISNTAAEIWTFMRYLMPAETLKDFGIYYFDDFVRNFGNITQMLEFATNGKFKENNRFAGYVNLPELVRIWSGVADTVRTDEVGNLKEKVPEMEGGKAQDIYLPQTRALRSVMRYVNARLEEYDKMSGKEKKANSHIPLTMYGIAKAAAVDARLVLNDAEDEPNSKTNEAVRQTLRTLEETADYRGTVAIFADNYQNKESGFNLYEDIRKKLIAQGVPEDQIVVMKSGMSVKKKLEIFDKVNAGEIRVIMGSTFTLGTGVNIQERLHTLIHVDAPNRPMDYTQRNGRILRQGNLHKQMGKPVRVLRFGVEDSLDVTAYQRLKTKGAIADSIMHGKQLMSDSMANRTMEEDEDVFGDVVAQLSGSEYALLKNQAEREVRKLEAKRKQWEADQIYIHSQKPRLAGYIKASRQAKAEAEAALKALEGADLSGGITIGLQHFNSADEMGDFIKEYNKKITEDMDRIRKSFMSEDTVREMTMTIGGFDFNVRTVMARDTERRGTSLNYVTRRSMSYTCDALGLTAPVPVKQGLLRNAIEDIMENVLTGKDARERIEAAESSITRNEQELAMISEREGRPFEQADELQQARVKLKDYEQKMKAELEAKESKYAEMDASVEEAKPISVDDEDDDLYREEDDADIIRQLESGPTIKVYRSMILTKDGKLLPPMSEEEESGKRRDPESLGTWYRSDERPDLVRNGKFPLRQSDRRGKPIWAAYAPYFHAAENMLNDQFKRAQDRGDLVVVECEIPASELTSGYIAEKSKKAVGRHEWKAGDLQGQTSGTRSVYLSRWIKPVRVVPAKEQARHIYELIEGTGVIMPTNSMPPQVRKELEKMGVPFVETTNQGIVAEGEHKGEYYTKAYPMPHPENFGFADEVKLRDVLSEGGSLAIMENKGKWRIEGMPGEFNTRYSAIDEWRERAAGNVMWYFSEDGNSIIVEGEGDLYETMSRTSTTSDRRYRERLARQQEARVKRGRQMVDELAKKLGITVRYVDDMSAEERAALGERKLNSKGWYSPRTGEVYINLGRHTRLYDMEATFLHEVVAHKGLRRLFGKDFDTFIDNIYNNVNKGIRAEIDRMAEQQKSRATGNQRARHDDGHWRRVATEEYMARLAERLNLNHPEERTIWEKIREYVIDKLRKIGVHLAESLSDNDLRGLLWESYHSMEMEGVVGVAKGKVFRDQMEREANNGRTAPVHETAIAAEPAAQYTGTLFDMITPQAGAWQRMMSNMSERELFKEISQDGPNVTSSYTDEYDRRHIKDYNRACDEIQARLERELPYADRLLELLQDATRQWEDGAYKDERRSGVLAAIDTISRALDEEGAELPSVEDDNLYRDEDIDWDAQASKEELAEHLRNIPDRVGIKPSGITTTISNDSDLEAMRGVVDDALYKDIVKNYNNPKVFGGYDPESGMIIVFTNKVGTRKEAESTWWHEKGHLVYDALSLKDKEECGRAAMDWLHKIGYLTDDQYNHYSDTSKGTEGAAWLTKYLFDYFGTDGILYGNFTGNEKIAKLAAAIQNYLKNGEENDNNRLRQPADGQGASEGRSQAFGTGAQGPRGRLNQEIGDVDTDDVDVDGFEAGRMTFEESITAGMLKASADNRAAVAARTAAMRALGGNLSKLRQAMARQREYDRGTVDSIVRLARSVMESGYFKGFSPYEVKRLMSLINHAAGREDITKQAGKVVDLLLKHQLLSCENLLHEQMRTRGSKLNASGVEVQAGLDIEGQRMVAAMKYAINLDADAMQERIWDALDRMGSADQALADVAAAEYQGLLLAQQYIEDIKGSKQEENDMRYDLQQAEDDMRAGTITRDQYRQYVAEVENAIRENRLERVGAYDRLTTALGIGLNASVERAKEWRELQKERVNEIRHNANSDLEGIPADEHVKPTWMQQAANWSIVRFFMKPLANFDYMLRMLGRKNVNGEGYLWQRFMGGWTDAADSEWRNLKADHNVLDEKVSEVFLKDMRWSDLFTLERKLPGMDVSFWDAGEQKIHTLSQGNMLYIYMVNKMSDGRMKLRKMGINEEDVEAIRQQLDPRFIELADWLQEEFLVNKRNDYNKVYQRMFGASMAAIEHYFPLKINSRSRGQEEDLSSERYLDDNNIGSTITGSIIKRKRNSLPLDVTGADAFDVVLGHLQDMEHWAAFAEFNRDLNTLLSYKRFRNRLLNMSTLRFGSGKTLWMNFKRTCAIASGAYRPKMDRDSVDTTLVNVAKGVTAAKISFRLYTAMKQLLSYPAYLSEASGLELIKSSNPIGAVKAWNWALAELPGFAQRWQSRQAGDSRLRESDADWGLWRNKIVSTASRLGMSPNAFIDGLTVAMGAKAIYETKLKRYRKAGYTDELAKKKALRDASISYNETQQSNANAYLSAMQLDRSAASVALTVFRNASMGYQRRLFQSIANLKHIFLTPGYKEQALEFMTKQMVRDGLDEQQAQQAAARVYRRATYKNLADFAIFGWVMQMAWNLGPYLPYLLMGDDDDDKKKMWEDAAMHALAGGIEGLSGGNVMSDTYNAFRSGQVTSYMSTELLPLMSDIEDLKRKLNQDMVEGAHDLVNLIVQAGVGVNPQQITDWLAAGLDVADGDPELAHEFGMFVLRFMSVPQSQLDKLYIDELGLTARDAQQLNATQMAERYARYKMRRGSMYTSWAYSDEGKQKAEERYLKRFETKVKERIAELDDEQLEDNFNTDDALRRQLVSQEANTRIKAKVMEGVVPAEKGDDEGEWKKVYERKRDYTDLAQDILLTATRSRAKKEGNTNLDKAIAAAQRELTTIKKGKHTKTIDEPGLGEGFDDDVMQRLRERRRELLKELGIM